MGIIYVLHIADTYYFLSHSIFEKNDIISMNLFSCIEFYDVSFHNKFCFMESLLQILIEQNLSTYLLGLLSHLSKMKKNRKCCNWQVSNTIQLITLLTHCFRSSYYSISFDIPMHMWHLQMFHWSRVGHWSAYSFW